MITKGGGGAGIPVRIRLHAVLAVPLAARCEKLNDLSFTGSWRQLAVRLRGVLAPLD